MIKKISLGILCSALLTASVPVISFAEESAEAYEITGYWSEYASDSFAGGDGSAENPYQISNASELAYFAEVINEGGGIDNEFAGLSYAVTADIELSDYQWIPIGIMDLDPQQSHFENCFYGTFDGGNYTINGLTITYTMDEVNEAVFEEDLVENYYAGLFGFVTGAEIKNVVLKDVNIETDMPYAGSLAGMLYMRAIEPTIREVHVSNCYMDGNVKSTNETASYAGSVAGVWETMGNHVDIDELGNSTQYIHGIFLSDITALCNPEAMYTGVLGGMVFRPGGLHNTYFAENIKYLYSMNLQGNGDGGIGNWFGYNKNYGEKGKNGSNVSGWDADNYIEAEEYTYNQLEEMTPVYPIKAETDAEEMLLGYSEKGEYTVDLTLYYSSDEIADAQVICNNSLTGEIADVEYSIDTAGVMAFSIEADGSYIINIKENQDVIGDFDGNGALDLSDYIIMNKFLSGNAEAESSVNMDLNGDEKVNVFDMIYLKKLLLNS